MHHKALSIESTALLVVDVQDKLVQLVDHSALILKVIQQMILGMQTLEVPIFVSEQYPEGLGSTALLLQKSLGEKQRYHSKTTFSCVKDFHMQTEVFTADIKNWVLVGIEAHICILQTAKDLLVAGKNVVVIDNAISSRSLGDCATAKAELREMGARVTSCETLLFELLQDSKNPKFKAISQIIK